MPIRQQIQQIFRPKHFEFDASIRETITILYPNISWEFVDCIDGLPWFMQQSSVIGTVLPSNGGGTKLRLYCKNYHQLSTSEKLDLIVHEAYHIQQYLDTKSCRISIVNWGFNRRFIRLYIAWYLQLAVRAVFMQKAWHEIPQLAYRMHPLEIPAYAQEESFRQWRIAYQNSNQAGRWDSLICSESEVVTQTKVAYRMIATLFCMSIALISPVVECLGKGLSYILGYNSSYYQDNSE